MGYFQAKAAKSVMISDMEKLLMLRIGTWLSANKDLAPCGVIIESRFNRFAESRKDFKVAVKGTLEKAIRRLMSLKPRNRI